jgi:hypothetical protein
MAAPYRLNFWGRILNQLVRPLLWVGRGPRHTGLLTVRGCVRDHIPHLNPRDDRDYERYTARLCEGAGASGQKLVAPRIRRPQQETCWGLY